MNSSAIAQKESEADKVTNQCYEQLIGLTTNDMESMQKIIRQASRNSTKYVRQIMTLPVKKVEGLIRLLNLLIKCLHQQEELKQYFQTKFALENLNKLFQFRLKQKVENVQLLQKQKSINQINLERQEENQSSQLDQLLCENDRTQQIIRSIVVDLSQEQKEYIFSVQFGKLKIQSYLPWFSFGICLWLTILYFYDLQNIGIFNKLIILSILEVVVLILRLIFYYTIVNCGIIRDFILTQHIKKMQRQIIISQKISAIIRKEPLKKNDL